MKKRSFFILIVCFLFFVPDQSFAQSVKQPKTGNTKKQMKRLEKLEKQKDKDQVKAEKELLKGHLKKQDKSTRKMMKKTKKKSKRNKNKKHAEPLWKKLFRKK